MQNNTEISKEQQVNQLVERMLKQCSAEDFRELLSDMYLGYHNSVFADDQKARSGVYYSFTVLGEFFNKLQLVSKND